MNGDSVIQAPPASLCGQQGRSKTERDAEFKRKCERVPEVRVQVHHQTKFPTEYGAVSSDLSTLGLGKQMWRGRFCHTRVPFLYVIGKRSLSRLQALHRRRTGARPRRCCI